MLSGSTRESHKASVIPHKSEKCGVAYVQEPLEKSMQSRSCQHDTMQNLPGGHEGFASVRNPVKLVVSAGVTKCGVQESTTSSRHGRPNLSLCSH